MIGEPQPLGRWREGFCIYINTLCQGPIPIERDENGKPVVYPTQEDAEREIAKDSIERLRQYLDGEREFPDAITIEEYVVPVTAFPDGSITDESGNVFPSSLW